MTLLKAAAAAAILAATASLANAAPPNMSPMPEGIGSGVTKTHGDHRVCARDRRGWHRHNRFGERRPCREWRGRGARPDSCVRVGPIWLCDY